MDPIQNAQSISNLQLAANKPFDRTLPLGESLNTSSSVNAPFSSDTSGQLVTNHSTSFAEHLAQKDRQLPPTASDRQMDGTLGPQPKDEAREAFQDFVGQTLYSQMMASLRSTQGETAYFNGGQAEKIFQSQFDQYIAEYLSDASASQFAEPMYELFQLRRGA